MFCGNCYNEIPKGKNYFRHQASNQCFCSLNCMNDWLIYSQAVTLETSEDKSEDERNTEEYAVKNGQPYDTVDRW